MSEEAKHTPGPWVVDEGNTPNGVNYYVNHLWTDEDGETHTDEIAEVVMDYHGDIARRNADLLAAAPDLLQAAKAMVNKLVIEYGFKEWQHELKKLRAAIAKAEGRTPVPQ